MPTLETLDPTYQFYMFKGEPGTRKSTQALSFPKPQYWFDCDIKMESMLIPMLRWGINPKDVIFDSYQNWDEPKKKLEQLALKCAHPDGRKYETIIVDSFTAMMDWTLRQTLKVKGGEGTGKKVAGIQVNSIEDYNAETATANELVSLLKDIKQFHKVNIILIAHVMEVTNKNTDGETSTSRTIVTAAKRTAAKLPGYCTEVYHFDIEKSISASVPGEYSIITENTGDDFARTGLGLARRIKFGERQLFPDFIKPAIEKLKEQKIQIVKV